MRRRATDSWRRRRRWDELKQKRREENAARQPSRSVASEVVPSGKHKGKKLGELTPVQIQAMWASWRSIPKRAKHPFFSVLCEARKNPGQRKGAESFARDESASTHYRWTDPDGQTHWIPNDVDMRGRADEPCPFDAEDELDHEFRGFFKEVLN